MESPVLEDYFGKQWTLTIKACSERMEPYDRGIIRSFRTYQDIQEHVFAEQDEEASEAALHELAMLQPRLIDLKNFSEFFSTQLFSTLDTGIFWGLLGLLLTLALQHDDTMRRIVQMLKKQGRNRHDFILHCRKSPAVTKEDKESSFDIFLRIVTFLADAVQLLRKAEDDLSDYPSTWSQLTEKFATAVEDIFDILNRIERVATIYQRQYQGDLSSWLSYLSLSPHVSRDTTQLPCYVLPPIRTTRFFDRNDVIEKIDGHFRDSDSTAPLRSLALYGMGGVGKSHVAMKYLEKNLATKEYNAMFWVKAKSSVSIQQSFTEIALRLKLPDTRSATHDENRMILKGWLQQTTCKWMVIYDNAETSELLRDYLPLSGSTGRILITTRNHSLGFDPADAGLEVLPWDTATGSRFLLHLLAGQISAELLANETDSAYSLSEKLSGHALALSNMCGLIHRPSWSISELVEVGLSFESLQPDCAALLSVFTFCAPDSIPQSLFETDERTENLTDGMLRYLDPDRLSANTEELYLLKTQNWRELEDLVSVNKIAMQTLPQPDKEIYLLSSTEIHVASMWAFWGQFKLALNSLLTAHSLKQAENPVTFPTRQQEAKRKDTERFFEDIRTRVLNKGTHPAKYARCRFKLSEALRQAHGQEAEADLELANAKASYFEIVSKTFTTSDGPADSSVKSLDQVHEKDFDSLIHISQR
ncbi:uncharacterized protein ATNIH1004_009353 [Aspergillus tanneri]|uniref:NB-ARC domain-containing protein n=1 Tax=Aspergillus tanneri TaxID=1220188 RepID=A0A5M9MH67_9EURO|nr:uncharacterized protein ATNIH1004_009353 [Aspergillus tanneri]KAA8645136.1 hypothetical protein ATNIH1004_009353 [Aspergillus tanneri]